MSVSQIQGLFFEHNLNVAGGMYSIRNLFASAASWWWNIKNGKFSYQTWGKHTYHQVFSPLGQKLSILVEFHFCRVEMPSGLVE